MKNSDLISYYLNDNKIENETAVQLNSILETMDSGVIIVEINFYAEQELFISYLSPMILELFELDEDSYKEAKINILEYVYTEDHEQIFEELYRVAREGTNGTCQFRDRDDLTNWYQIKLSRLDKKADGTRVLLAILTDISELKNAEMKHRISSQKFEVAMELSHSLVWEYDIEGKLLTLSSELVKIFNCRYETYTSLNKTLFAENIFEEESKKELYNLVDDVLNGIEGREYILKLVHTKPYVAISFRLINDKDGKCKQVVGIVDILYNVEPEIKSFKEEELILKNVEPAILGTAIVNLSEDQIVEISPFLNNGETKFSKWCDILCSKVNELESKKELEKLSLDTILKFYNSGNTWMFLKYYYQGVSYDPMWTDISIKMIRHPIYGDVYAYIYFRNINYRENLCKYIDSTLAREANTGLYTNQSLKLLFHIALADMKYEDTISLVVIEFVGFEQIRNNKGMQYAHKLQCSAMQLYEKLSEERMMIAYMDENHLITFRTDIGNKEEKQIILEEKRKNILQVLKNIFPEEEIDLCFGFTVSKKGDADFDEMARRCIISCNVAKSMKKNMVWGYEEQNIDKSLLMDADIKNTKRNVLIWDYEEIDTDECEQFFGQEYQLEYAESLKCAKNVLLSENISLVNYHYNYQLEDGLLPVLEIMNNNEFSEIPIILLLDYEDEKIESRAFLMGIEEVIVKNRNQDIVRQRIKKAINSYVKDHNNPYYEMLLQQQSLLLRQSEVDELTGILNTQGFHREARKILDTTEHTDYVLLRFDIDNFKVINDENGMEHGDKLLKDIALFLKEMTNYESTYGRIESDHYAVLIRKSFLTPENFLQELLNKLSNNLINMRVGLHVGVFEIVDESLEIRTMSDRALIALRSVKASFTVRVGYYNEALREKMVQDHIIESEMETALAQGQFTVYLQPQYSCEKGEISGMEALVRWNHPTKGVVAPYIFIPIFERNGFISKLDEYVWEQCCILLKKWREQTNGKFDKSISINISRVDVYDPRLATKLIQLVKKYEIPIHLLKLEITESAYMDNPDILISVVKQLKEHGFTVEMDDFGSGYSSLNTLKDVPVDTLKLDMRFLMKGEETSRRDSILMSVINMAKLLHLSVIGEGVETKEQADQLRALGCDYLQGYYFAKPMPINECEDLLFKE
ncbi:MAG: EAL domain-containing protein [Lachnospiraceae bacterium]